MAAHSSTKGFSLVELMVALAVLAIGMSAIGTMLLNAFWHDRHNTEVRNGEAILRRVAEGFAAGNPENLPLTSPPTGTGNAVIRGRAEKIVGTQKTYDLNFVTNPADVNPGTFFCAWNATVYKVSASGTLNRIDVVVGWGGTRSGTMTPCDRNTPESCRRTLRLTNYY